VRNEVDSIGISNHDLDVCITKNITKQTHIGEKKMPPSGSVPMFSPMPNKGDEPYGNDSPDDDVIGALGSALADFSMGTQNSNSGFQHSNNGSNAPIGSGSFSSNINSQQNNPNQAGHVGLSWGSPSNLMVGGNSGGFTEAFTGATDLLNNNNNYQRQTAFVNSCAPNTGLNEQFSSLASSQMGDSSINRQQNKFGNIGGGGLMNRDRDGNPIRTKSLDIFLSRSPSETLGTDILAFKPNPGSGDDLLSRVAPPPLPVPESIGRALTQAEKAVSAPPPPGMVIAMNSDAQSKNVHRQNGSSPSCSVTGTSASSRSVSPSSLMNNMDGGQRRTNVLSRPLIEAYNYNQNDPSLENTRGDFGQIDDDMRQKRFVPHKEHGFQQHHTPFPLKGREPGQYGMGMREIPSNDHDQQRDLWGMNEGHHLTHDKLDRSPPFPPSSYINNNNSATAQQISIPLQQQQQMQQMQQQSQPQPQQVFYMSVATQDGRGQVLQPVQMVQLPGHPPHLVIPPPGTSPQTVFPDGHGYIPVASMVQGQQGQTNLTAPIFMSAGSPPVNYSNASSPSMHHGGSHKKQGNRKNKGYVQHQSMNRSNNHNGLKLTQQAPSPHEPQGKQHLMYHNNGANSDTSLSYGDYYSNGAPYQNGARQGNAAQGFEDRQFHGKKATTMPSSYVAGDSAGNSQYTTPSSSQRSSPLTTPAANDSLMSLYASPQRPPLSALLGHVRRLSKDQVGCRLLQQSLEEEGPVAATAILNEGLSFWGEAMVDPFGNYLFQKILEKITLEERVVLVRSVSARLVNASLNLHGTRSVQKVVELCAADEMSLKASVSSDGQLPTGTAAAILTQSLAPSAARLCIDSHGNHVIQRILLKLPYHHCQFVFDAVAASVGDVARHRHGCCVIQRCLDSPMSEARSHLVRRIVEKSLELMQDAYGNYVVQYVLDVCGDDEVHAVCESVIGKVGSLAIQKFSSNVMEKCLERCTDRVRELYLTELSDPERIRELMMDPFGNYVVQRALSVASHAQAVRLVEAMTPHLIALQAVRNSASLKRIMTKICRRFPNFNLGGGIVEGLGENEQIHFPPNHHRGNHQGHQRLHRMPQGAPTGPMNHHPQGNHRYARHPSQHEQQQIIFQHANMGSSGMIPGMNQSIRSGDYVRPPM